MPFKKQKRESNPELVGESNGTANGTHTNNLTIKEYPNPASAAATAEDRNKWQGWCEIESEPAFFNVMLNELGAPGIKVQEMFSLDDESLLFLPRPAYGLIFLFQANRPEPEKQGEEEVCPNHVWFSNQTGGHSCATVAMLNVLNNIPHMTLGEELRTFKEFTADFTPVLRGYQLENFQFVKAIHNSFARKKDMLNTDLGMEQRYNARKRKRKEVDDEEQEPVYHFQAFVPVNGDVWKLDGIDSNPVKLGTYDENVWLDVAAPLLNDRMAQLAAEGINYNLLCMSKDPLITAREDLVKNIMTLQAIEKRVAKLVPDWQDNCLTHCGTDSAMNDFLDRIDGPNEDYGITEAMINPTSELADLPKDPQEEEFVEPPVVLWKKTMQEQTKLRNDVKREQLSQQADSEKATGRRHDYAPTIQMWLRMLAENETLQELVEKAGYV
ncbi:ubiquitin carboxyl-terminal hydrolase [Aulographum hederae CBS 113979]|uniref:Ubiquitin carboxyl-terminal hydrolase n=1 Tax=Aulographum hederae CBS 113979 TaxID=1176131 RepID=A0A6G1GTI0_9PEZI|nr:ubiquitin carboxyl-terminal hydrolase [Aulographum hederae CBS 113979]